MARKQSTMISRKITWYRLGGKDGHTPVPTPLEGVDWNTHRVAQTQCWVLWRWWCPIPVYIRLSTVFLALDHSFGPGPSCIGPRVFETMAFYPSTFSEHPYHQAEFRTCTWEQAVRAHKLILSYLRWGLIPPVENITLTLIEESVHD